MSGETEGLAGGETVTLTATPNEGFVIDKVTVLDENGGAVAVAEKDGKYTIVLNV